MGANKVLLVAAAVLLVGCGQESPAAGSSASESASASPIDTYVDLSTTGSDGATFDVYIEVTTQAALQDVMKIAGAKQLDALPGGSEIACHKTAGIDGSKITIWDDGTPDGKTFGQEECNKQ